MHFSAGLKIQDKTMLCVGPFSILRGLKLLRILTFNGSFFLTKTNDANWSQMAASSAYPFHPLIISAVICANCKPRIFIMQKNFSVNKVFVKKWHEIFWIKAAFLPRDIVSTTSLQTTHYLRWLIICNQNIIQHHLFFPQSFFLFTIQMVIC